MKVKEVLAAGIVQDLLFRDALLLELYLYDLDHKKTVYQVLDKLPRDDGSVIIRIVKNYNGSDLIQL